MVALKTLMFPCARNQDRSGQPGQAVIVSPPRTALGLTIYPSPQKVMSRGARQGKCEKEEKLYWRLIKPLTHGIHSWFFAHFSPAPSPDPCKKPQALWSILYQLALLHICGQVRPCPPLPLASNTSYLPDFSVFNLHVGFPGGSVVKNPPARDVGSIPGSGRSPGEWNGNPLQYSCLENSMDWGSW